MLCMKILMGLDYGSRTVGVAFSDALYLTAQPAETIFRDSENKLRRTLARIEALAKERGAALIVLGQPVHMDGSEGERVEKCAVFKEMLERRTGLPVVWQDERLTTVEADEILEESGVPREERKKYIDQVAASLILRDYMNAHPQKETEAGADAHPQDEKEAEAQHPQKEAEAEAQQQYQQQETEAGTLPR